MPSKTRTEAACLIDASRSGSQFATLRPTVTEFPNTNAYWSDHDARARMDAEIAHNRALVNDAIDAGLAKYREKQAASRRWNEGEMK